MTYADICRAVEKVIRKHGENDPFRLCDDMGIVLIPHSLGTGEGAIKGFFLENKRVKTITYNSDLPEVIRRIIVAHEIGHAELHCRSGVHAFHDVGIFDESTAFEKEANLYAAELLLKDEDVLEKLNEDNTFFSAASALKVPVELLDFKFRIMKWKGYKLTEPPVSSRSDFLRDLEVPSDADGYTD